MNLAQLSVKRPITTLMFFLGIILIGLITLRMLPIEMMPNISFGYITIHINVRGGISAAAIEKRISKPVEESVGSVSHLKNLLSISKEGNARIVLEFEPGTDMDFAALEVREHFNRVRGHLPSEIEKPVIAKYQYEDAPIMILAVTSETRSPEDIREIVDDMIKEKIQRIPGAAQVEVVGGREGKIMIEVDQNRLQAYGLPIERVVHTINVNNANLLVGEIKRSRNKYLIRALGELTSLKDIENLAIATTDKGAIIRIKDIAKVKDSFLDPVAFARVNAQPAVSLYIQKESLANTVRLADAIGKELDDLDKKLEGDDIEIVRTFDQAEYIRKAVNQVRDSLLTGAILASLILLIFLRNPKNIFIIISSIPLSLLLTFSLMFFTKLSLNVMSLSGLALGVGMLVDSSIVVLENIFKKTEPIGVPTPAMLKELSIEGTQEMILPIFASTLTTLVVFIPLVFVNPETKLLYKGVAITICFSLISALLVSLTLIPLLCSRLSPMRKRKKAQEAPVLKEPESEEEEGKTKRLPFLVLIRGIIGKITEKIRDKYQLSLAKSLSWRYVIVGITAAVFAVAIWQGGKLEREFVGVAEQNKFTIFVEMPTGTKIEISDEAVRKVEEFVSDIPEVKTVTAKVEPWSSKVYVELHPLNIRKISSQEVMDKIRPYTERLQPAFIYFEESEEVGTKEVLIEIFGYEYEILKNLAIDSARRMKGIPKFTDVKIRMREGRPEMWININKPQAALLGLSAGDIALSLHTQMRGLVATRYRGSAGGPAVRSGSSLENRNGFSSLSDKFIIGDDRQRTANLAEAQEGDRKEVESIVRLEEDFRKTFEDLKRISLVTPEGNIVYLSQVADLKYDFGPSEIWRKNKARMVQVSANTGGTPLGTAAEYVKLALKDVEFPRDYFWQLGGDYHKMIRNQKDLTFAITLSLVLVYMILASLFESFIQPFIILLTVPLAAIGAIFLLRVTHKPISVGVLIGAMLLGGIVVNNAIILIDRINFYRKRSRGSPIKEIAQKVCAERTRPILMTSLTTIFGLLRLALDRSESSNLWSPLALTVIGGLCVSTFLTLYLIPGMYIVLFEDINLFRKR